MTDEGKRIVICLDGTWNNPYQMKERDDGSKVLKPTNPLKMCRAVLPYDSASRKAQLTYYDIGVGALGKYPGVSNRLLGFFDSKLGGAWGAGFEANVEGALTFLVNNYHDGDQVYVFGFSRGAAQARGLTRFLDWVGGMPTKGDAYFVPLLFHRYIVSGGKADPKEVKTSSGRTPELLPINIELLGVWDTVMALGSRFRARGGTSVEKRSFHVGKEPARCVLHARQAVGVDEKRYDFRPEIWLGHHGEQTLKQRWFPGVHSNVGGGYVDDGLANIAFRWLLSEAEALGLATDPQYVRHYRPYPQDRLYESKTVFYRVMEAIRFRFSRGKRRLEGFPDEAHLTVDKSVIHRMNSAPSDHHDNLVLYRPDNVLEFLAGQSDLDAYLQGLGLDPKDARLPDDVMKRLEKIRHKQLGPPAGTPRSDAAAH